MRNKKQLADVEAIVGEIEETYGSDPGYSCYVDLIEKIHSAGITPEELTMLTDYSINKGACAVLSRLRALWSNRIYFDESQL